MRDVQVVPVKQKPVRAGYVLRMRGRPTISAFAPLWCAALVDKEQLCGTFCLPMSMVLEANIG